MVPPPPPPKKNSIGTRLGDTYDTFLRMLSETTEIEHFHYSILLGCVMLVAFLVLKIIVYDKDFRGNRICQ